MNLAKNPRPLKVLIVTKNRAVQRRLSQFLVMVRYQVLQAADAHSALVAVDAQSPDVALLGGDLAAAGDWELCHILSQRPSAAGMFKILMIKDPDDAQVARGARSRHRRRPARADRVRRTAGAAARGRTRIGIRPSCARARAARRVNGAAGTFQLRAAARRTGQAQGRGASRLACVVIDIDFFGRIDRSQGTTAGEALLRAVAQQLVRVATGDEIVGYLGEDRFGVILPGKSDIGGRRVGRSGPSRVGRGQIQAW